MNQKENESKSQLFLYANVSEYLYVAGNVLVTEMGFEEIEINRGSGKVE